MGRYGVSDVVLLENWLVDQDSRRFLFDFSLGICMARLAILAIGITKTGLISVPGSRVGYSLDGTRHPLLRTLPEQNTALAKTRPLW